MPNQTPERSPNPQTLDEPRPPRLFAVILHNDDYTTMEFVVSVLIRVFGKSAEEAARLMMDVHRLGRRAVAAYPYDIAESKAAKAEQEAAKEGFPLRVTVEPSEEYTEV